MKSAFAADIWNTRLQIIWIFFAAIYLAIGAFAPSRFISSLLVTLGATIICAFFAHSLVIKEAEKSRSSLMIAFVSCFFLAEQSHSVFNDSGGSFFNLVFGLMCALLLWYEDQRKARDSLAIRFFVTVTLGIVCSYTLLLVNLLTKLYVKHGFDNEGYYLIAPHTTGILGGMGLGLFAGIACFGGPQSKLDRAGKRNLLLLSAAIVIIVTCIQFFGNRHRLENHSQSLARNLLFCALYSTPYILFPAFLMRKFCNRKRLLGNSFMFLAPLVISVASSATAYLFFGNVEGRKLDWLSFFFLEINTSLIFMASLFFSLGFFKVIAKSSRLNIRNRVKNISQNT